MVTGKDVFVFKKGVPVRLAVQQDTLDVFVFTGAVFSNDRERVFIVIAVAENHAVQQRRSDFVASGSVSHGIEAHGAENIPGGHLAGVVIAADAVRVVRILLMQNPVDHVLRLVRSPDEVIKIGRVVTGFISVRVLPDQAGDVTGCARTDNLRRSGEESVQFLFKLRFAAHNVREAARIMAKKVHCQAVPSQ